MFFVALIVALTRAGEEDKSECEESEPRQPATQAAERARLAVAVFGILLIRHLVAPLPRTGMSAL